MTSNSMFALSVVFGALAGLPVSGQPGVTIISVDVGHPGAAVSPDMFGVFFEDINFGADGGLYPERIKNRSFEFNEPLAGWHQILAVKGGGIDSPKGAMEVRTDAPLNPLTRTISGWTSKTRALAFPIRAFAGSASRTAQTTVCLPTCELPHRTLCVPLSPTRPAGK